MGRKCQQSSLKKWQGEWTCDVPLASLVSDSLAITCPHGSNIGGFCSVDCSFDTGQAKMEWNL